MAAAKEKKKNALINYFEASYQEIRKVAWPTRNQAIRLTFLVLGFVLVVAIIIGILDYVFGLGHSALLDIAPDRELPTVTTEDLTGSEVIVDTEGVTAETLPLDSEVEVVAEPVGPAESVEITEPAEPTE